MSAAKNSLVHFVRSSRRVLLNSSGSSRFSTRWTGGAEASKRGKQLQLVAKYRMAFQLSHQSLTVLNQLRVGTRTQQPRFNRSLPSLVTAQSSSRCSDRSPVMSRSLSKG